jgi:RNA-directed DNA polymerase
MRTEKFRLQRSLLSLRDQMRQMRHQSIQQQVDDLNVVLRGHYVYYGIAGNIRALQRVYRAVERYWCKMLRSRSWAGRAGRHFTWPDFNHLKERTPLLRPKLRLPYRALQALAVL